MVFSTSVALGSTELAYFASAMGYMAFAASGRATWRRVAVGLCLAGLALHSGVLLQRIWQAGRPPFSNMYETLLFFSWVLVLSSLWVERRYGLPQLGAFSLPLAALVLATTSLISAEIQPLLPALKSNWLLAHVVACFVSYTAFALACGTSGLYLLLRYAPGGAWRARWTGAATLDTLDALTYRLITFGFPLLTIGIVTGAVWADQCWGRYWSWDPKETWSLVTWLVYGVCLHLRLVASWRGPAGAVAAIAGFLSVVFTYYGVNYLFVGLHDYA